MARITGTARLTENRVVDGWRRERKTKKNEIMFSSPAGSSSCCHFSKDLPIVCRQLETLVPAWFAWVLAKCILQQVVRYILAWDKVRKCRQIASGVSIPGHARRIFAIQLGTVGTMRPMTSCMIMKDFPNDTIHLHLFSPDLPNYTTPI